MAVRSAVLFTPVDRSQECLEDKKRRSEAIGDAAELSKAIETLRRQLSTQQEVVGKYEAKVKKRESEVDTDCV